MTDYTKAQSSIPRGPLYPPRLAEAIFDLLPGNVLLERLGLPALGDFLSEIFFASLQMEEGEHQPIRAALTASALNENGVWPGQLSFLRASHYSARHLLRLARAASSERIFVTIISDHTGLWITGLARERFGEDERSFIKVRASKPGCLEVWVSGERILEYVRGYIQRPPEDVLLAAGPVREKLLAFAQQPSAPAGYVESVASILRHLADHPHGGILVLSEEREPQTPPLASYAIGGDTHLWDLLHAMERLGDEETRSHLERETVRYEIQRSIAEIGRMTALDGATILDCRLGLRGFGIVLPVRPDVVVNEVVDAAGTMRRSFALDQYGARHRAAASYASTHTGSLVFIASTSGDIGCMLKDEERGEVLLWRFRSGDLSSPAP